MKLINNILRYKYLFVLLFFIVTGGIIIQGLLSSYYSSKIEDHRQKLINAHNETVLRLKSGINVYSTIVSSIKSFTKNSQTFPNENEMHLYLKDLISNINFKDSIVVSFVDTNQIFQYTVTPNQIDPFHLKGLDVNDLRPKKEIENLNRLMYRDSIHLFPPINLIEGWAGFPFNFSARNNKNKVLGYIAPIINVKYLLDYSYKNNEDTNFIHRFIVEDSFDLSREVVYDGTKIYNSNRDGEFYKNFNKSENDFLFTDVKFYNLKLTIGTAFKTPYKPNYYLAYSIYFWYILTCILSLLSLNQFIKNKRLNKKMRLANVAIIEKNDKLNKNYLRIEMLLKEIHHRVKNNMQIISSLLNLQKNSHNNKEIIDAINTSKNRIQSMALVHQKLYGSEDLTRIKVLDYVTQLVTNIENTIETTNLDIKKTIDIDKELTLSMDTILPLGLILNELLTNSYKYAFKDVSQPKISITILKENNQFKLIYTDNGIGIPKHINIKNSGTLGLDLINMLTEQLKGSLTYNYSDVSKFTITFKEIIG